MEEFLHKQTLLALDLSIDHWRRMSQNKRLLNKHGRLEREGISDCALCTVYRKVLEVIPPQIDEAYIDLDYKNLDCITYPVGRCHIRRGGNIFKCPLCSIGKCCLDEGSPYEQAAPPYGQSIEPDYKIMLDALIEAKEAYVKNHEPH